MTKQNIFKKKKGLKNPFEDQYFLQQQNKIQLSDQEELKRNIYYMGKVQSYRNKKLNDHKRQKDKRKNKDLISQNWLNFKKQSFRDKQKFVAIDCQMVNCIKQTKNISCLARISIVNENLQVILDKYVKPQLPVKSYLTWISGITPSKLNNALSYSQLKYILLKLLNKSIIIGHSIQNDLNVLDGVKNKFIDIRQFSKYKCKNGKYVSLKKLAYKQLGINIQEGQHSSSQDAIATMQLFLKCKKQMIMELL